MTATLETQVSTVEPTVPSFAFEMSDLSESVRIATRQHPALAYKIERAISIVVQCPIERGTGGWLVGSLSRPGSSHWVQQGAFGWTCGCPDALQRGNPCKHSIAVRLHRLAGHLARQRAVDAGVDDTIRYTLTDKALEALGAAPETASVA